MPALCHGLQTVLLAFRHRVDNRSRYNVRQGPYDVRLLTRQSAPDLTPSPTDVKPRPLEEIRHGTNTFSLAMGPVSWTFSGPEACHLLCPLFLSYRHILHSVYWVPLIQRGPKALGISTSVCYIHKLNQSPVRPALLAKPYKWDI